MGNCRIATGRHVLAALRLSGPVLSQSVKAPYPEMAPAEQYRIANREDEIALALSAAPPSISGDARRRRRPEGYLGDAAGGPWLPHIMFFLAHGEAVNWGASKEGSPVIGRDGGALESTVLLVPVRSWSDGTPAPSPPAKHQM